jgi:hypothetical protein
MEAVVSQQKTMSTISLGFFGITGSGVDKIFCSGSELFCFKTSFYFSSSFSWCLSFYYLLFYFLFVLELNYINKHT